MQLYLAVSLALCAHVSCYDEIYKNGKLIFATMVISIRFLIFIINKSFCNYFPKKKIYRHGDRPPTVPYATDPYNNVASWPTSFGQLSTVSLIKI